MCAVAACCQLHLRVCGAPYEVRLTSYPYSTASGGALPLPLLLCAHETVVACDAFELVSAVSRRCLDLDERRNAADLAQLAAYTSLLSSLPPLIDCYVHLHADRYQALLAEYGRGLSPPHSLYLRSQRKRRLLRWAADARLQSAERCLSRIERVLDCFSRALHSSACEYLFSSQPSSADVQLAAYVAFIALAPHEAGSAATAPKTAQSSAQPQFTASSPFTPLSALLDSHPLLAKHSRLLFDRFFPAYSFQPAPPTALPASSCAAFASAAAVAEYVKRSELTADASVAEERMGGAAGLLFELRGRLSEPPLSRTRYVAPAALSVRGGDQWVEQSRAALSPEERERAVQRSRRMWLLGGAALVLAFVLWQRSKVSPAAANGGGSAVADTAALSVNTS